MALPRIDTPTYQTTIPSTGQTINYRPFLVKEQKVLMMAQESKDQNQTTDAVIHLVRECTFNQFDVENAPTFDIEHLFLRIRGKSVGEMVDLNVVCPDDEKTNAFVRINLDDIKLETSPDHNPVINLTDTIKIHLSYPSLRLIKAIPDIQSQSGIFKLLYSCIKEIHYGDDVYTRVDISDADIENFVDQLTSGQFETIIDFFNTMPRLKHTIKVVNPNTKVESEVNLEGLQSFLA